jgi:hypothetical protein
MIRNLALATAVIGGLAAAPVTVATPAAADVVVKVKPGNVYVAPRRVYVAPRRVVVKPRCRWVKEKVVVRRPGPDVVRWRSVKRCW